MSAVEYGSNYWCVILNGANGRASGDTIFLHADSVDIDATGTLTFHSVGRRPAGVEPEEKNKKDSTASGNGEKGGSEGEKGEASGKGAGQSGMIYVAFAPGTWKMMYAAKLQDGSPASVEHWNAADGNLPPVPADAGVPGFRGGK
jgi:hypothetical protein